MFTNDLKVVLLLWGWDEKTVYAVETHWLFGREKVTSAAVNKEIILTVF